MNADSFTGRETRFLKENGFLAGALALAAFFLYLRTLAPGLLDGDSGELQMGAALLGVVHATGYPLYLLLGQLLTLLPVGDPAWRVNLLSAITSAATVGVAYLLFHRLAARAINPSPVILSGPGRGAPPVGAKPETPGGHCEARFLRRSNLQHTKEIASPRPLAMTNEFLSSAAKNLDPAKTRPSPAQAGDAWVAALRVTHHAPAWVPRAAAAFAAAAFAVSGTFWSQAVIAEVYGLHALLVALVLYFILCWAECEKLEIRSEKRGARWLWLAALCLGLGLAHHRTIILLLPALMAYITMTDSGILRQPRKWLPALSLTLIPLLLYAYIPLRAPHTPYLRVELQPGQLVWLYTNDLNSFLALVTGSTFGGSLGVGPDLLDRLQQALGWLAAQFPGPGLPAGLAVGAWGALWQLGRRRADCALLGLTLLATVGFCLLYRIGDIYVLYIPAYLALAGWLAIGAAWLLGWLAAVERPGRRRLGLIVAGVVLVSVPAFSLAGNFAAVDRSSDTAARARSVWAAILAQPLPANAVLVTNDRNEAVPLLYLQHVEGQWPGLTVLFPPMLPGPAWADVGGVTGQALATGRPVYLIKPMPGLDVAYELAPAGPIVRVTGPARTDLAHPLDLPAGDTLHLTGYEATPAQPGQGLAVTLAWRVVKPPVDRLGVTIRLLDDAGNVVAAWDGQPGGEFYPPALWQPGASLRVTGTLDLPADLAPGTYTLHAGFYTLPTLAPLLTPAGAIPALGRAAVPGTPR